MNAAEAARWIVDRLDGVVSTEANGDAFFFAGSEPADQRMPFATIVTSDFNDTASDLSRPGAHRVNLGVSRESYTARFGPPPSGPITVEPVDTGYDYTARDTLMPHPIYASLAWVCVVEPTAETLSMLEPLLEEAHAIAVERRARRESRG